MKIRYVWVQCPDCGRSGTDGGCFTVERRWTFGWTGAITTYDRDGAEYPRHFPTLLAAEAAVAHEFGPKEATWRVVKEVEIKK